ncbi:MAG TPA: M48 family metalloprotease [Candidatus Dormibacteraeota bacterium]|nr:M48 family metalloprotease [Candidatus Dormibacteraeota bacterium]
MHRIHTIKAQPIANISQLIFLRTTGGFDRYRKEAGNKIECPKLCLVDSGIPSACTVRTRRKCTIVLSIGLFESLDRAELEACLAHEIGHRIETLLYEFVTMARIALFARVLSYFEAAF